MSENIHGEREFGKWRTFLWPVHNYELRKLLPMLVVFFLITIDYNIIRTLKDTLVVTAKGSGAEVIPFIKVWAMFPTTILMTYLFTHLSNRFSRETVIYTMFSFFLLFFFVFTFILYPNRDVLHPHASADFLAKVLPSGFKGLIAMYRNWTFTAFYVMAEMWGNIVLFVLFWGFANQVTRMSEAKRFYGLFGIGANASGVAAGQISVWLYRENLDPSLPFGTTGWEQSLMMLMSIVLIAGVVTLGLFYWMNKYILTNPLYYDPKEAKEERSVKGKLSMRESFSYLIHSRYLLCLAVVVIAYNSVINLAEVLWKHEVRELYPHPGEYNLYMNEVTTWIGVFATFSALLISGNSIRKFGWTFTALITPVILLVTSVGFFGCFLAKESYSDLMIALTGTTPLALAVLFGSAQNILSRAAKYSVFDATKEMAYVPLEPASKIKGKAAIDGVAARLGKSSGSFVHQMLLLALSSFSASAPYIALFLMTVIVGWIIAVKSLGKQFNLISATKVSAEDQNVNPIPNTSTREVAVNTLIAEKQAM